MNIFLIKQLTPKIINKLTLNLCLSYFGIASILFIFPIRYQKRSLFKTGSFRTITLTFVKAVVPMNIVEAKLIEVSEP